MIHSGVPKSREHARVLVVQKMTAERPPARIVSIKCDRHSRFLGDQHRVTNRPGEAIFANSHDLKRMAWPLGAPCRGAQNAAVRLDPILGVFKQPGSS